MKKLIIFSASIILSCLLWSCSEKELVKELEGDRKDSFMPLSLTISEEKALENLSAYLVNEDSDNTRGEEERKIDDIYPVFYKLSTTRSEGISQSCPLVYIANFENKTGYAILAADESIPEAVIAIIDEGELPEERAEAAMKLVKSEEPLMFTDFPLAGLGFFTLSETDDELYMNPNTANMYDVSKDDALCGDFTTDNTGAVDDKGNPIISNNNADISTEDLFTVSMCLSYARHYFESERLNFKWAPGTEGSIDDGSGISASTYTTYSDWKTIKEVTPILPQYKLWTQNTPFNDLYPKRHRYGIFGHSRKAFAGCFPLAVAKILTHFRNPYQFRFNGYIVNWQELHNNYNSQVGAKSAAHLLYAISLGCDSWYFYNGTFTFPSEVKKYLRRIGYNNANTLRYTYERVCEMLNARKPLIMYSVPNQFDLTRSHAWNADGFKIRERTITKTSYYDGKEINKTETQEISNMVHCDFGWGGTHNGYYVDGVFQLNGEGAEVDPGSGGDGHTNYNTYLHVVVY